MAKGFDRQRALLAREGLREYRTPATTLAALLKDGVSREGHVAAAARWRDRGR